MTWQSHQLARCVLAAAAFDHSLRSSSGLRICWIVDYSQVIDTLRSSGLLCSKWTSKDSTYSSCCNEKREILQGVGWKRSRITICCGPVRRGVIIQAPYPVTQILESHIKWKRIGLWIYVRNLIDHTKQRHSTSSFDDKTFSSCWFRLHCINREYYYVHPSIKNNPSSRSDFWPSSCRMLMLCVWYWTALILRRLRSKMPQALWWNSMIVAALRSMNGEILFKHAPIISSYLSYTWRMKFCKIQNAIAATSSWKPWVQS